MEGFLSRFNRPFSAGLKLAQSVSKTGKIGKWKTEFVFEDELELDVPLDESTRLKAITLPNGTEAELHLTEKAYHLPALKTKDAPEGFRLGKTILQKELQPEEIEPLFTKGKTALLDGFISRRTKRPFKAHLTLDFEKGEIGFEFAAKKTAKKKTAKKK